MRYYAVLAATLLAPLAILGCASSKVTDRETYQGKRLARPDRILVHDFAVTAEELPAWSEAHDYYAAPSVPRTAAEIATGRQLGAQVAAELVADIREMGLPAVSAAGQPAPKLGDLALVGYFESIDEGRAANGLALGFASGTAELKTRVEGYLGTDSGMRRISSGTVDAAGSETPEVFMPLVNVATANPIGALLGGTAKAGGESTGKTAIDATAKRTADAIAEELHKAFKRQRWI
jgi:hypothetical protein